MRIAYQDLFRDMWNHFKTSLLQLCEQKMKFKMLFVMSFMNCQLLYKMEKLKRETENLL